MTEIETVLQFWLEEVGPGGWYATNASVDDAIRGRFAPLVERALGGTLADWAETSDGALALLILLDQFPRNLHRGSARAFSGDALARDIARIAVSKNLDLETAEPERQFFYLPFEHSEDLGDQDWSVALFQTRMSTLTKTMMWHVEQHRDVIQSFGRFPFRNKALERESTSAELAFLDDGGYSPGTQSKDE